MKEKIESVNQYEALIYQTKSTLEKKEVSEQLSDEDKNSLSDAISEHETWLNDNREMTDKEMIEQKTKEFQGSISGIMGKLYQGQDMSGGMPENPSPESGPTIDEVD